MIKMLLTLHVDFPALDNLVAYLKARDGQQLEIAAMSIRIGELVKGLQQSEQALKGAESQT